MVWMLVAGALANGMPPVAWQAAPIRAVDHVAEEGDATLDLSLVWPELPDTTPPSAAAAAWIREQMLRPIGETQGALASPDALRDATVAAWEEAVREAPDGVNHWFLDRRAAIVGVSKAAVSVCVSESLYMGGAHPASQSTCATFDRRTGEAFTLPGLFGGELPGSLMADAEAALREERELDAGTSLVDAGFWLEGGLVAPSDWSLTGEGLMLHYDAYEIAPYALGPSDLRIAWELLPRWMQKRYRPELR